MNSNDTALLPQSVVKARVGRHEQTLMRWRKDPTLNFPQPVTIRGRLYWHASELQNWLMSRQGVADETTA
jgi:predicted DNA-binding transcriptional regulator AlpA